MKKIKLKSIVAMLALFMAAVFVEVQVPVPTENTQEARFLGIRIKKEVGTCTFGNITTWNTFTIFYIQLGDRWPVSEGC